MKPHSVRRSRSFTGTLKRNGISLSWFIDLADRVRLLVTWTEDLEEVSGVIFRQPRTYDYSLSCREAGSLTPDALLDDVTRLAR